MTSVLRHAATAACATSLKAMVYAVHTPQVFVGTDALFSSAA